MRGVVMSVKGDQAVLLTKGGDFRQVRNRGYSVGDRIKIVSTRSYIARIGSIAAAVAVFAVGGISSYYIPASYVSVDINPSFIMTLNVYNKVIDIEPLNDEAKQLLEERDVKGMDINDSIDALIDSSEHRGYVDTNGDEVIISVVPGFRDPQIEDRNKSDNISYAVSKSDKSKLDSAREMGVTIPKADAIAEYTATFGGSYAENAAQLEDKSVKEIRQAVEESPSDPPASPSVSGSAAQHPQEQIPGAAGHENENQIAPKNTEKGSQIKPDEGTITKPVNNDPRSGSQRSGSAPAPVKTEPKQNGNTPAEAKNEPQQNDSAPAEIKPESEQNGSAPASVKNEPEQNRSASLDMKLEQNSSGPTEMNPEPKQNDSAPALVKTEPEQNGNTSAEPKPEQNGIAPAEAATEPKQNDSAPASVKAEPEQNGNAPADGDAQSPQGAQPSGNEGASPGNNAPGGNVGTSGGGNGGPRGGNGGGRR